MADIKYSIFADTAAAERAFVQLEQKVAKLENALTQVSRKSKDGTSFVVQGLKAQAASVASLISGYISLGALVTSVYTENLKVIRQGDEIATQMDVRLRKWRILTNQNEVEGEEAQGRIHGVGQQMGFTNAQAMNAARELTSAGFTAEEASGASLRSLLKSLAANQNFDRDTDAGPLAKASANYLQSQGQALTGENLERIGMMADKLGDVSTFNIADVEEIAKHGATMAGKISQEEQFAATTHLITEGRPGSEAANSLEKITLSLTGKADKKKTVDALKELGLEPGDVDMIGESFVESLKRLNKGLEGIDPTRRDTVLAKLFGVEHFSPAKSLITKNATVEGLTQGLDDREAFELDVDTGTSGRAASGRRLEAMVEEEHGKRAGKYSDTSVLAAYEKAAMEGGYSAPRIALNKQMYNLRRGLGQGQEGAIEGIAVNSTWSGDTHAVQTRMIQLLEETSKSSREQTELMKKAEGKAPQLNRNAQGEGAR